MPKRLIEQLTTPVLLSYARQYTGNKYLGELLFPAKDINELSFKYVVGAQHRPVMARVVAFNAEASIASRRGGKLVQGQIVPIKRKVAIDEETFIRLEMPRPNTTEFEDAIRDIYRNDVNVMIEAVKARIEKMRMDAITTGKVTLDEDGIKMEADYGVLAAQKETLVGVAKWSDHVNSTPIDDMNRWVDAITSLGGIAPSRAMTSKKVVGHLLQNASIRKMIWGDNGASHAITRADLSELLNREGLPAIVENEDKYDAEAADGTLTLGERFFPENMFVMFPESKLGDTLYAPTAEALRKVRDGVIHYGDARRIFVDYWETEEPVGAWTKAAALSFPTMPAADSVFQATVL